MIYLQGVIGHKISKSFYGYNRQTLGTFFQVSKKPMKMALFGLRAELQEMLSGGMRGLRTDRSDRRPKDRPLL